MGLLDWLFKKNNFKRAEDAYALTREILWDGLRKSIDLPQTAGRATWLIVHFTDTFTEVQEKLEQWGLEYEIVSSRLNVNELERLGPLNTKPSPSRLKLILADLIPEPASLDSSLTNVAEAQIAMIVLERHPQIKHDQRLEAFARSLPCKVEFGYFLALDDAVIKISIEDQVVEILKQLGLDDELISSNMVTRRLETVLKRISSGFQGDTPCNSAAEWLETNKS